MNGRRVLVVDDDDDIVRAIRVALEREGARVRVARNAVQALALADVLDPDLILVDLMMPVSGGWDFVRRIRAEGRFEGVPLVVMSALVDVDREAERLGVDRWLKKPFDLDALLSTVRAIPRLAAVV